MRTFYVTRDGSTDDTLPLYFGHHENWHVRIDARGTTVDMVDWQYIAVMECRHIHNGMSKMFGLIYSENKILTDWEGDKLGKIELAALRAAGFNISNAE